VSDTILSGDFTVYYEAENRQKRIKWSGSATGTRTANELYSALQDLFDELNQMDDGTPISAQTPTEYTIGIIDPGDDDPWFMDLETAEHLTNGAITTASWTRVVGSNTGLVVIPVTSNVIVLGDVGNDITHDGDNDAGTLLDVIEAGATDYLVVRPDSNAAANNFDTGSGGLTCNGNTATQAGVAVTGEQLWANIYTIGTIEANTHIYVYQNVNQLTAIDGTSTWWPDGQIDILVPVKDYTAAGFPLVDEGYITVFARQYSKLYGNFEVDLSGGGRNPIPLATADDLDNETGVLQMVLTDASDNFTVGEIIEDNDDSNIQGIVTSNTGTAPNITLQYYLIGDPISGFYSGTQWFTGQTSTASGNAVGPTDVGPPALGTLPTIVHANTKVDIDDDGTDELYSVTIDCNQNTLADVYEWCKYITRRGETGTTPTDGIEGERYIGTDYYIDYSAGSLSGTINEGVTVSGLTSLAKGVVVAHHTTDEVLMLRNSRGSFSAGETVQYDTGANQATSIAATAFSPKSAAPFGTFAGGKFFCARGVVLTDYKSTEENSFQLIDDTGTVRERPTSVSMTVTNTRLGDRVAVFRLTVSGGIVNKAEYSCTVQAAGATTLVIDTGGGITADTPGKSLGGTIRLVDVDAQQEYRLRFSSWSSSTFTLASTSSDTLEVGSGPTDLVATGAFTNAKVGDLIRNQTRSNAITYLTAIADNDNATCSPAVTDQQSGDTFDINVLPVATATDDTAYVPLIDAYETIGDDVTPGSEGASLVFSSTIYARVRVRNAGIIIPFEVDTEIGSGGASVAAIRTVDSIYTQQ
jgi:hypothetical protein